MIKKIIQKIFGLPDRRDKPQGECGKINRRLFIKSFFTAIAGVSLPALFSCTKGNEDWKAGLLYSWASDYYNDPDDPPPGTGTVAVVRSVNMDDMVGTAIDLAGGIDEINSGDTVVIKPNIVYPGSSNIACRFCTNPEVLRSVIRIVASRTAASNITIAEASAYDYPTVSAAKYWGIYDVCIDEGANFLAWDPYSGGQYVGFSHPKIKYLSQPVLIPQTLSSFDHFINLPMLKNHRNYGTLNAVFTSCMKNFVGVLKPSYRTGGENPLTNIHTNDVGKNIAEIGLCVPNIIMNIIDATLVVLTGGPSRTNADGGMKYADANLIIASKDRVACDTVGVAVLRAYARYQGITAPEANYFDRSVFDYDQIRRGCQIGLGRRDPDFIDVVFNSVDNSDGILAEWV